MWVLEFLPVPGADTQNHSIAEVETQGSTQTGSRRKKGTYHLVAGEFLVGRRDCDIMATGDPSVSRRHARVTVGALQPEEVGAVGTTQPVHVTDLGAKFHTRVNEDFILTPQKPHTLRSGDVLTFGNVVKARVWHLPLVLCLSRVSSAGKQVLKTTASAVGAHIIEKWRPTCTHLVVEKAATATTKVCLAVVHSRPVVAMSWLTEGVAGRTSLGLPLPKPSKHRPDWSSLLLVRDLEKSRRRLLAGLVFLLLAPEETEELVRAAGARVERVYEWALEEGAGDAEVEALVQAAVEKAIDGGVDREEGGEEGGGVRHVVVLEPPKGLREEVPALAARLEAMPGVYVTQRQQVAEAIFRNRPLRDSGSGVIQEGEGREGGRRAAGGGEGGRGTGGEGGVERRNDVDARAGEGDEDAGDEEEEGEQAQRGEEEKGDGVLVTGRGGRREGGLALEQSQLEQSSLSAVSRKAEEEVGGKVSIELPSPEPSTRSRRSCRTGGTEVDVLSGGEGESRRGSTGTLVEGVEGEMTRSSSPNTRKRRRSGEVREGGRGARKGPRRPPAGSENSTHQQKGGGTSAGGELSGPSLPPDGWMRPWRLTSQGQAREGREEEGEEGETVVEERDLRRRRRESEWGEGGQGEEIDPLQAVDVSRAIGGGGAGRVGVIGSKAAPRVDFKRFRKNVIRVCAPDARVRRLDMVAVLPRESEMEMQLRQEEALAMARREEGERLFEEEERGPRRRR
ncbi:hypothetical protein NSK_004978 [Nannochloropsis salina CCMP1776]|uniref:FHA domain-containing protein n=1 Tax=Nannochloropsis salina CCMP1776 TaxID=1027361 RepID=A0A4D9CX01_9STRA|nr:hypothetical protein NSK_004978 [Nannochloropsis salina CCMP1776]|eukprot:TFJ83881.1 hypothetical protein NSK_004978 [Nannochloropsis salina CCMP1776]